MNIFDIIEKEKWHRMQEGFSKALGLNIQTVDLNGRPSPGINTPSSFCLDIIKISRKDDRREHEDCIPRVINRIKRDEDENYCICPFGLYLYGIPIEIKEEGILAYVIAGPVMLQKRKDPNEYKKIARDRKIPLDSLMDKLSDLKKFSFVGIESAVELLQEVAHYIVQLNYDIKKLKERFRVPRALDSLIKELYSSVHCEELLNALLDACLNTSKGNSGSIMLLDEDKNELSVKFSRGLKDSVVEKARVKVGGGISGIAAKNRKPLLLDDSIKDLKIKNRLKRPYIKSSIVYPLEVKNRLFGVINLNSTDVKRRFDSETLDLIGNFTHLAKIALGMFPKT